MVDPAAERGWSITHPKNQLLIRRDLLSRAALLPPSIFAAVHCFGGVPASAFYHRKMGSNPKTAHSALRLMSDVQANFAFA